MTLEHTSPHHIQTEADSVQLRLLNIPDARALFELVEYDRDHFIEFGHEISVTLDSVTSAQAYIGQSHGFTRHLGIWDEGVLRGEIDLTMLPNGLGEVGYWVGKEHIGHRYASRAQRLLTDWAFDRFTYFQTLQARINQRNIASQRTALAAGYWLDKDHESPWLVFRRDRDETSK